MTCIGARLDGLVRSEPRVGHVWTNKTEECIQADPTGQVFRSRHSECSGLPCSEASFSFALPLTSICRVHGVDSKIQLEKCEFDLHSSELQILNENFKLKVRSLGHLKDLKKLLDK